MEVIYLILKGFALLVVFAFLLSVFEEVRRSWRDYKLQRKVRKLKKKVKSRGFLKKSEESEASEER